MRKKLAALFKNRKAAAGLTAVLLAVAVGGTAVVQQNQVPELPSYTDPILETNIEEDETPLASAPKTTTKTSKKTSTKNVKLKSAAKKSYTKTLPKKTKTSQKNSETTAATVTTKKTVVTAVKEKYTKKSKVKKVTTTTTTTVVTTTTAKNSASSTANTTGTTDSTTNTTTNTSGNTAAVTEKQNTAQKGPVEVGQIAPKEAANVLSAFRTLGFTVEIDPSVNYTGYFNARNQKIIMRDNDPAIYHELGHFIAFVAGNVDTKAAFQAVYNQEKSLYTAYNKAYVTQNSAEYFAESAKEYILSPSTLKAQRPKTYEAIKAAYDSITDARVATVKKMYSIIWK